jgi:hypothetical protein
MRRKAKGFGWREMFGVRESSIDPGKEVAVKWGAAEFTGASFAEHFTVLDEKVRVVAKFADGTAAYELAYGKGSAILLGTFAGQWNEAKPAAMHPLGAIPAKWGGIDGPGIESAGAGGIAGDERGKRKVRVFV